MTKRLIIKLICLIGLLGIVGCNSPEKNNSVLTGPIRVDGLAIGATEETAKSLRGNPISTKELPQLEERAWIFSDENQLVFKEGRLIAVLGGHELEYKNSKVSAPVLLSELSKLFDVPSNLLDTRGEIRTRSLVIKGEGILEFWVMDSKATSFNLIADDFIKERQ